MTITQEQSPAYFATEYRVFVPTGTIALAARGESDSLARLHDSFDVVSSAFITAYSPHGRKADDATNRQNQTRLVAAVTDRWKYFPGEGADPKGIWPAEPSLLVLGIGLEDALSLGREYHQQAILFATAEGRTDLRACWPEDQTLLIHPLERRARRL